ncbi:MAG: DNA topoisomerase VI subunit B [Archaeoglobi archaeon]|nr:DNA topoisomerase VI subunit B [Candidatus Mnemosynella bozhongmuii]
MEDFLTVAEELAKRQRAISVAEFFEKNRHILGFDSKRKSLITAVKEAVDNSLDACEEAEILPDIRVEIDKVEGEKDVYRLVVEDNGPGIVKEQIPNVFGRLLYGSRFHSIRQSRGQQGIGISAAVLYAQLTTGKPAKITSRIHPSKPAYYYELMINTQTNEPEIIVEREIEAPFPRGTRVELELEAQYIAGYKEVEAAEGDDSGESESSGEDSLRMIGVKQSVYGYLKSTAIVNPHARIFFRDPYGFEEIFERVSTELPKKAVEIKPHPEGIDLGTLMKMMRYTERTKLISFLENEFSRLGRKTAREICAFANLDPDMNPREVTREEAVRLLRALKSVKISAPPLDCLSPIGEEMLKRGLMKEFNLNPKEGDFVEAVTRNPSVYLGNPFLVEAAIAYSEKFPKEEKVELMRYANRTPLLYQQGGCAITHAIERINWRNYGLSQPGGTGNLPVGPAVIVVHVASTNVPYTSESKEAIASVDEILNEIELAVRTVARKLKSHLDRQEVLKKRREKEEIISEILPLFVDKISKMLGKEKPDISPIIAKIMGNVLIQTRVERNGELKRVVLRLKNFGDAMRNFKLYQSVRGDVIDSKEGKVKRMDGFSTISWDVKIKPGEEIFLEYFANGEPQRPVVDGIEEEMVTFGGEL